jgi:SAM-dependent methyltransferase
MIDRRIQEFLVNLQKYAKLETEHLQVPVEYQTRLLGLDESAIETYSGSKAMDFGCGEGKLVYHLRERGIDFEGMDIAAPDEDFFIRQSVTGIHPNYGCVPRKDNTYDLVVAFQNGCLNRAFTVGGEIRNPANSGGSQRDMDIHTSRIMYGQFIALEALRILKKGARAVFYPNLTRFQDSMRLSLLNEEVEISSEEIPRDLIEEYTSWEFESTFSGLARDLPVPEGYFELLGMDKRTVLIKG